ncbi:MAG: hypothetical protein OIF40_01415 [Mangrovicoccus sp.]|nr:hypothetical protein [Mangrovicoccus sp.]
MEEKRKDLRIEKQKRLLEQLVAELSRDNPGFYYQPTGEIAFAIQSHIRTAGALSLEDKALLDTLSQYDIQLLLSLH